MSGATVWAQGFSLESQRNDFKQCRNSKACGSSCIPKTRKCHQSEFVPDVYMGPLDDTRLTDGPLKDLAEYKALKFYVGNGHTDLNRCARKQYEAGSEVCKNMNSVAKRLDSALDKLPKNIDKELHWRGFILAGPLAEKFKSLNVGSVIKDSGYASFSKEKGIAIKFATHMGGGINVGDTLVMLASRSQNLTEVSYYSPFKNERESIMPRNTKLKILKRDLTVNNGVNVLVLSVDTLGAQLDEKQQKRKA